MSGALVDGISTNNAEFLPAWSLVVKESFYSAGKTIPSLKMTPKGMKLFHCIVWGALQHHLKWALLSVTPLFINPEKILHCYIFIQWGLEHLPFSFHLPGASGLCCHKGWPLVTVQVSVWVTTCVVPNASSLWWEGMGKSREDQPWAASLLQGGGSTAGFTAGLSGSLNQYCCYCLVGVNTQSFILLVFPPWLGWFFGWALCFGGFFY